MGGTRYCRRIPRAGEACAKQGCPFWAEDLPSRCAARDREGTAPDKDIQELLSGLRRMLDRTARVEAEG